MFNGSDAKPWDFFREERVSLEIAATRISTCEGCEELFALTRQCKKCGCFMDLKTKLPNASCPLGKWSAVESLPGSAGKEQ